ncbi:hypothetical protein C8F04DRAFT_1268259 [Mycena alexandri]|uniref:Uncharacterized protein n=1 Tax=Mycena alexandri TaxID=1745969 RepID=A0AAD6WVG7_9AGAR|nr:hypothetical protein C8F04DRAFT_1268259 [Mycena alexandri]
MNATQPNSSSAARQIPMNPGIARRCRDNFTTFIGLCVNSANEPLQAQVQDTVFAEHTTEGLIPRFLPAAGVPFVDNAEYIRLLQNNPGGKARKAPKKMGGMLVGYLVEFEESGWGACFFFLFASLLLYLALPPVFPALPTALVPLSPTSFFTILTSSSFLASCFFILYPVSRPPLSPFPSFFSLLSPLLPLYHLMRNTNPLCTQSSPPSPSRTSTVRHPRR